MEIKKVVVIGSGTMGSGIAAHLCNADVPVTLLDLTTEISEKARERIHKSKPPLYGICLLLKPKAAKVPKIIEPIVANIAIIKLFFAANPQGFLVP